MAAYNYKTTSWNDFGVTCKDNVRKALSSMNTDQGEPLCSYCESTIAGSTDGHIEHLHRKRDFPSRTFDWSNLFLCCQNAEHCGHFKDRNGRPKYNPDNLIRPDTENPDEYLQFFSSGEVLARSGLSVDQKLKADATIDVLNLNHPSLKGRRSATAHSAKAFVIKELEFLETLPESERIELLSNEIDTFRGSAHPTVARHFFTNLD